MHTAGLLYVSSSPQVTRPQADRRPSVGTTDLVCHARLPGRVSADACLSARPWRDFLTDAKPHSFDFDLSVFQTSVLLGSHFPRVVRGALCVGGAAPGLRKMAVLPFPSVPQ